MMTALRFFCLFLVFSASIAWADDDAPPTMSGYPYTDLTYDALLNGEWTGLVFLGTDKLTIRNGAMVVDGCPPLPYVVLRDEIRVDRDGIGPDAPHSESYRDIAIKLQFTPPCTEGVFREQPVLRFLFNKDDLCTAVVTSYRSQFDLPGERSSADPANRRRNGVNVTCPLSNR